MGINPPTSPIKTKIIPSAIFNGCFNIYRFEINLLPRWCSKFFLGLLRRYKSKKLRIKLLINGCDMLGAKLPTSITYLIIGEYKGISV